MDRSSQVTPPRSSRRTAPAPRRASLISGRRPAAAVTSAAAQAFSLPLVAHAFGRVPLLSPLLNVVAVPLASLPVHYPSVRADWLIPTPRPQYLRRRARRMGPLPCR